MAAVAVARGRAGRLGACQLDLDEHGRTALQRSQEEAEAAERRQLEEASAASAAGAGAGAGGAVTPTPSSSASTARGGGGGGGEREAAVASLTEMGFSRAQAVQALAATDGNAELAAAMLLG
jgi:hypothetical protein